MRWARAQKGDGTEVTGVLVGDMFHPRASLGSETATGEAIALGELTLLAPVKPGKFIGPWNNYKAAEKGGMQHPEHPLYFARQTRP